MEFSNCRDDVLELLTYFVVGIISEVTLCLIVSFSLALIWGLVVINILWIGFLLVDWIYLGRSIVLDESGITFKIGPQSKHYSWEETNIYITPNNAFLFGDSEIPGEGLIISTKEIAKRPWLGAQTYCRLFHPWTSVFIRFVSYPNEMKPTTGKFVYKGFCREKHTILSYLEGMSVQPVIL